MKALVLHIEEIFEENDRYFRLTIQVGAVKISGRLRERSLIYLMKGAPATLRNVQAEGWVTPVGYKKRLEVDSDSFNFWEIEE